MSILIAIRTNNNEVVGGSSGLKPNQSDTFRCFQNLLIFIAIIFKALVR